MTGAASLRAAADRSNDPQVSSQSRLSDHIWRLDIDLPGFRSDQKIWRWAISMADGSRLTDPKHATLLEACKRFLWSLASDPPEGHVRASPSTLLARALSLAILVRWMSDAGFERFADLDAAALDQFRGVLKARRGRGTSGRALTPCTLRDHLAILKLLYVQRAKLPDALSFEPFPGETAGVAAGLSRATKGWIPFIPDTLAIDIIAKALDWVEHHADPILERRDVYEAGYATGAGRGMTDHYCRTLGRRALHVLPLIAPAGPAMIDKTGVDRIVRHLHTACFIVIAGLVGMRMSEILSLKAGAIERREVGETGLTQAYLVARLYKTAAQRGGREERWLAPAPVVRAIEVLERLTAPLPLQHDDERLFIVGVSRSRVSPITSMQVGYRLREFAAYVGVPHHEGAPWPFSAHQFRKTFARFVAKRDRSQLLALADHFKHVSVAMTAKGYVGTDFDLYELVAHEAQAETADALDRLLSADKLAGRMGERLTHLNAKFRGRAGAEVRRDYVQFILSETDLAIHACEYGWCVFQAETARCGGDVAPSAAGRAPSVCLSCVNFAVDARHRAFWNERRRRNLALRDQASPLTRAALDEAIAQCDAVLSRLDGVDRV
ncbi:MAG: hypothetical protein NW206_12055 [Hyphomonadaceae bacterium]|nr:hypothetical protein [Hyphomonadaceae bacterium]